MESTMPFHLAHFIQLHPNFSILVPETTQSTKRGHKNTNLMQQKHQPELF
jgi:hypothetical protein